MKLFEGRIGRKNFLIFIPFYLLIVLLFNPLGLTIALIGITGISNPLTIPYFFFIIGFGWFILILSFISFLALVARRLRDLNISGLFSLLLIPIISIEATAILFPVAVILLIVLKGKNEGNKYGPVPQKRNLWKTFLNT